MVKIKESAKQVVTMLLEKAIRNGNTSVFLDYPEFMEKLSFKDRNYLKICLLYLYDAKYLNLVRSESDDLKLVEITSKGIDFAEGD